MLSKFNFTHFNIKTHFANTERQFINVNCKKNKIIKLKLPRFKLGKTMNSKTYQCLFEQEDLQYITKFYKRDMSYCHDVYKYILKQSQQLNHKHKDFPDCKNKYLVNKTWNYIYFMKGYDINYSYLKPSNKIVYNKIVGNILDLYSENNEITKYKIVFSKKIIKRLIAEPHHNFTKFMKRNFSYNEDISKLNAELLYKCLNDMIYKTKHTFINLLLDSYENIFGECYMESNGVVMELDYKNKKCFVNIKWNITKLMIM